MYLNPRTAHKLQTVAVMALAICLLVGEVCTASAALPDDTTVYWNGSGKRVHIPECRRMPKGPAEVAKMTKMTLAEAKEKGLPACSRCPGSELNDQRKAKEAKRKAEEAKEKGYTLENGHVLVGTDRGIRARVKRLQGPVVAYDPDTKVYADALWMRVHAADCPALILKDKKKTMTLAEADKAGYRIGESGQSGRGNCCLVGYRRKHPEKKLTVDTILAGSDRKDRFKHIPGCHRYWPKSSHVRRPLNQWVEEGFTVCLHCVERGPSAATVSEAKWKELPSGESYAAPEGWEHKPYPPDQYPSEKELEILIQETLSGGNGIQELQFTDPVATAENFMNMRFFFPVGQWLRLYQTYRGTGDERVFDTLLESARHYRHLSVEFPSAARMKANDPEGLPYMFTMAACARMTLQSARKDPGAVSQQEIEEAESFLRTIISVLKPTWEGSDSLDPEMGIPQPLADDFRSRAFNRAMNGIGTLSMTTAALEDLQALKETKEYQPTIDRYRKVVRQYIKNWFSEGHFCQFDGQNHFYYPYKAGVIRDVDGHPIFNRPEDVGHYSHTMQGLVFLYESTPEAGIDDDFMTAVANTMYHNATTEVEKKGKRGLSGHAECPTATRVRPYATLDGRHSYSPARDRFYVLQAFRDDMIDGLCNPLNEQQKAERNSDYDRRLSTLYAQYVKALRKDRSLIHLGEK